MRRRNHEDDDLDDDQYAEDFGDEDDAEDRTVPCPHCLRPVYEDAERCPGCGNYLSREDAPSRHPWWKVIGVLICLAISLWWITHFF